MRRALLTAILGTVFFGLASPAHAWTDARVVRAAATVDVARNGDAHVLLAVGVHVRGGWLEQIELVGLDAGLVPIPEEPPVAVDADGALHSAAVRVTDDGRVVLSFDREDAPHRGDTTLSFAYRAHLAPELLDGTDTARVRWTLPSWETGLDEPTLVLRVPGRGTVPDEIACPSCAVATDEHDGITTVTLSRTHLPRGMPWDVALDVPREALALPTVVRAPPLVPRFVASPPAWPTALGLAAALALLAVAKRGAFALLLARRGTRARAGAWATVASLLVGIGGAALAVTFAESGPLVCASGLALCVLAALRATPPGARRLRPGAFRPAARADHVRAARTRREPWLSPAALFDATTPLGALALVGLAALAWWAAPHAAPLLAPLVRAAPLLAAPLFVTSTRFQLPPTADDQLAELRALAPRLALPPETALALVVHEDVDGRLQEARLRIVPSEAVEGAVRLDVAIAVARGAGGFSMRPFAIALSAAASANDRALAEAVPEAEAATGPGGRRVARVIPLSALSRVFPAAGIAPAEAVPAGPRSRGSKGLGRPRVVSSLV